MIEDLLPVVLLSTFSPSCLSFQLRMWRWFQQYCPWVLQGLAVFYGMIVRIRRMAYQRKWLQQQHLPKPVISVGNVTVGGTGKTPFVIWLAHQLHAQGKRVAVLSRGYGRQEASQNLLVSDGHGQVKSWRVSGDEPTMISQHCPWAIVAVGPDRFQLGKWVLEQTACDCFLLDDGYQHLALYRDVNLLLFDVTDGEGLSGVLPAGRLREPLEAAKEADGFIFTRAETLSSIQPVQQQVENSIGRSINPIVLRSIPKLVQHLVTGAVKTLQSILEAPLVVVSGVGNPRSFVKILTDCGLRIGEELQFPDHCAYGQIEVDLIRKTIDQLDHCMVITTEKDAVKLREWFTREDSVWFLMTEIQFLAGEDHVLKLLDHAGIM